MDQHIYFLKTSCRLCGNQVKGKSDVADKQSFKLELWLRFQINVDVDNDEIHPSVICPACKRAKKPFCTGYETPQTQPRFLLQSSHFYGEHMMIKTAIV